MRNIGIVEEPKGSGRYYIRVFHKGRRYKRRAASKAHARELREEIRVAIRKGEWPPKVKPKAVLLDDLLKEYQEAKEQEGKAILRTNIGYTRLQHRFGGRYVGAISAADVEAWRQELLKEMSPATVNRHLQLLRAVLRRGIRDRILQASEIPEIKLLKENNQRVRFLSDDEEQRLLVELPAVLRPLVTVAIHTGMRRGELLNLMWNDVDFVGQTVFVRKAKSGEGRRIPMSPTVHSTLKAIRQKDRREQLRSRILRRQEESGYVFAAPRGGYLLNLNRAWYPALRRAGIEDLRFHDLRHSFASRLVMNGVDLYRVQTLMGHKTPAMTLRYAHLSPEHLRAAVATLDAPGPKPWAVSDAKKPLCG
ncbi:MAG: site-specific integrase [Deltaproteobacteria bacterium]|nr:site-specific integrase [Deltaproteobacteria bacterium]